jgi:hypothetical protein
MFSHASPRVSGARARSRIALVEVLFLLALSSLAITSSGAWARSEDRDPKPIRVPSRAYPTIQSAIDAAPDGGTILIAPGVYHETLIVQRKRIRIIGSEEREITRIEQDRPRELHPADQVVGLLNYENGGGGVVQNLSLVGGDAGILGRDGREGTRSSGLKIRNVGITASGHGILWDSSAELEVKASTITDTLGNGIWLTKGLFKGSDFTVDNAQKAGLFLSNTIANIDNALVGFNAVAGIYMSNSSASINNSSVFNNTRAGIWAVHSLLLADNTSAYANESTDSGQWGEGIMVVLSDAYLNNIVSSNHPQAGVANFGGFVSLGNSLLADNVWDLLGEEVKADALSPGDPPSDQDYEFEDGGNNNCPENGVDGSCLLETKGIKPPEPATPID